MKEICGTSLPQRFMATKMPDVYVQRDGHYRLIEAFVRGRQVGFYELCFSENYRQCDGGLLLSKKPNAGVPRAMIGKATKEIQRVAKTKEKQIRHEETAVTPKGKWILHIFEEFGYRRKRQDSSTVVKIYRS